jgi:type II protein arginine methyltransferase
MLTSPITTPHFQSSVQALISSYVGRSTSERSREYIPIPVIPALTPVDSSLTPHDSISQLVAVTSPWIDLCSPDPVIANISLQVFNLEVAYAAFCGIQNVIVPGPYLPDGSMYSTHSGLPLFARAIKEALSMAPYIHFQILLPMCPTRFGTWSTNDSGHLSNFEARQFFLSKDHLTTGLWAAWEAWNLVRSICNYHGRFSVALVVPKYLPPAKIQARWNAEPLKILIFPEPTFVPNKYSQPVLSKHHQVLLSRYMRLRITPWIILNDVGPVPSSVVSSPDPTPHEAAALSTMTRVSTDPTPHLSYFRALQQKQPQKPPMDRFGAGYQDYLQMPLQPLADNLESVTYEVFEKDPVKYELYEQAISYALLEWSKLGKSVSSENDSVVIAVAGAGRGPLVTRALHAAEIAGVPVEVWAVEKNPNAYVLLQHRNQESWDGKVTVVKSDMRAWMGPIRPDGSTGKVDILVSELLGSFADNELSPECLDGVQHVLNPTHGISIPASYTAFLTPIATPRLHASVLSKVAPDMPAFDYPYVVMLHSYDFLAYSTPDHKTKSLFASDVSSVVDAPLALKTPVILPAWSFTHPAPQSVLEQAALRRGGSAAGGGGGPMGGEGSNAHNNRFEQLRFQCPDRGECHGFAGYFESVLYASEVRDEDEDEDEELAVVELSTNPLTMDKKSKDMISWFPIYFPLKVWFQQTFRYNLLTFIGSSLIP